MRRIAMVFGFILAYCASVAHVSAAQDPTRMFGAAGGGVLDVISFGTNGGTFTRYLVYQNGALIKTVTPFTSAISGESITLQFGGRTCKPINAHLNQDLLSVSVPIVGGGWYRQRYVVITPKDVTDWTESLKAAAASAYTLGPGALAPYVHVGPCGLFAPAEDAND